MKNILNAIKGALSKLASIFTGDKVAAAFNRITELVPHAMPIIDLVATIGTAVTPTTIDDAAYAAVKVKFPRLFDGTLATGEEVKLYLLGVATEMLRAKFPDASTSIARAAVQIAYTAKTA
jgi:hypothetical protein